VTNTQQTPLLVPLRAVHTLRGPASITSAIFTLTALHTQPWKHYTHTTHHPLLLPRSNSLQTTADDDTHLRGSVFVSGKYPEAPRPLLSQRRPHSFHSFAIGTCTGHATSVRHLVVPPPIPPFITASWPFISTTHSHLFRFRDENQNARNKEGKPRKTTEGEMAEDELDIYKEVRRMANAERWRQACQDE
jgi:hypothetical protein